MDVTTASNLFSKRVQVFTGDTLSKDVDTWVIEIKKWEKSLFGHITDYVAATMVTAKLEGLAATVVALRSFDKPEDVFTFLKGKYLTYRYQAEVQGQLAKEACFNFMEAIDCAEEPKRLNKVFTGVSAFSVKKNNFEETFKKFEVYAEIAPAPATTPQRNEALTKMQPCQAQNPQRKHIGHMAFSANTQEPPASGKHHPPNTQHAPSCTWAQVVLNQHESLVHNDKLITTSSTGCKVLKTLIWRNGCSPGSVIFDVSSCSETQLQLLELITAQYPLCQGTIFPKEGPKHLCEVNFHPEL
ncbi:hypothetical protein BDF14DRAFT_1887248 [Spinellus fusiger]|nr:hypothetical protein BDF14DRAFT_1887248 [Spinellus fusiger]